MDDDPAAPHGRGNGKDHPGETDKPHPKLAVESGEIFGRLSPAPPVIGELDEAPPVVDGGEVCARSMPVSIYLDENRDTARVQDAVEALIRAAGGEVVARDEPVIGSWFRRLRAKFRTVTASPLGTEAKLLGAHALESRLVHSTDATVTATMMQNLAPVLSSLQPFTNAVVRVGALLIVKAEGELMVHQLTAAQQLALDHRPELLKSPRDILCALGLAGEPAPLPAGEPRPVLRSEKD
ncbi:hypothetical protein [Amycolatopsis samaneae]|uniref:Uncharacterized protein n=1 Tax=Amycolatopsis samaneae TaxID=664691 RepID=A0ABW5GNX3_9PSEU